MKVIDGWPCISESLQWAEGCPLYLMGQYAALQVGLLYRVLVSQQQSVQLFYSVCIPNLSPPPHTQVGPHAVNLAGGRAAAMRIAEDIMRRDSGAASEMSGGKSKNEEYIRQMQGLLWL